MYIVATHLRSYLFCHCEGSYPEAISQALYIYCLVKSKQYYVYIMTNKRNSVLYTGVTNNLKRRAYEHKNKLVDGFTKRYNVVKLVYCEAFDSVEAAICREKQIKSGSRGKKVDLISNVNKEWRDLYEEI